MRGLRKLAQGDRESLGVGAWLFGFLALLLAFGALAVAAEAKNTSEDARAVAALGGATTKVTLGEFSIQPAAIEVPKDGSIVVTNTGTAAHDFVVKGTKVRTSSLNPGESASVSLDGIKPGSYDVVCSIPGHADSGMRAVLVVGGATGSGTSDSAVAAEAALRRADKRNGTMMHEQIQGYVAQLEDGMNTKGTGNQPLEATVAPDGAKVFALTAKIVDWEVEPGRTVRAWAYNGQVPGPVIRVNDGDRVRIVVQNRLPQSTSVHFHGIETPNAMDGVPYVTQDPIRPGSSFTYEFEAEGPAVGMYHSHDYAVGQVSDGLAGAFIIGDQPVPAGRESVDQDLPMMLNDAGVIGFSLNGKSFPATAPIIAAPGETVRIHYLNEGQQMHPMHLHGVPQLVVAKDGFPLPQPYYADTVAVAPGERYTVLVSPGADDLGVWAYHCHILSHAEHADGMMFGMVTAFIVQEKAA